jgi:heptosyltransferase-2
MQNKTIFIEIPTWLGDAVMTTPAIENIINYFPNCKLIIFGSQVSTKLFLYHPNMEKIIIDNSKKQSNRYIALYKLAKSVGRVDIAFSFRKNFTTKFLLFFLNSKIKYIYKRYTKRLQHQVIRYNNFINKSLLIDTKPAQLKLYQLDKKVILKENPILGINPGATYGSAKRWYSKEFAKVAIQLSTKYDIVIFGGKNEIEMANDIEKLLVDHQVKNFINKAGKTSVEELIQDISNLDLFITNDSGPMHLSAAFKIPTVCIFGPTKYKETRQWENPDEMIVSEDFSCMPCMKRVCPLVGDEHHQCMKNIKASDVLETIEANIFSKDIKKKKLQKNFLSKYNLDKDIKIILFKARNFKQNGIVTFIHIIMNLVQTNFQAVICGDKVSINNAKKEAKILNCENKFIFLNNFPIKACDIFVLPTRNKKFANNILTAIKEKCAVFVPNTNEASKIVDIFATMQGFDDPNTSHKIDALLSNLDNLKLIKKENLKNLII